jgi:hypothetical protein
MTTPSADDSWPSLCGELPDHATEMLAAHGGTPGTGVPAPAEDRGVPDDQKYGGGGL